MQSNNRQYSRLQMIPGVSASFSPQSQRTLQARLMRANSCAKAPVKAGRGPVVQRIRINDRRNFAAVKGEFYFWPLIVKRSITAPGPLRLYLVDSSAEFCNEPCIEITSHPNKQRALHERTRHRYKHSRPLEAWAAILRLGHKSAVPQWA